MSPTNVRGTTNLEQIVDVETPEQVLLSYAVAGIGTRAAAAVLDMLIIGLLSLLGFLLVSLVLISLGDSRVEAADRITEGWALAALLIIQFLFTWGYHVAFEGFRDGQTPGKRIMRVRVVRDGGFSITPAEAAVRNILRIVDMLPPVTYLVGILFVVFNRSGKRIGDLVAGTMVVRERLIRDPLPNAASTDARQPAVTATLSEEEYVLLEQVLGRLSSMREDARAGFVQQLATRFAAHLPQGARNQRAALRELYERERLARASGMAARGDVGAARERHAILREGGERWQRFGVRLQEAQRRGLRALSEEEVSELVADYREVSTDLARLRTATGGASSDTLFHVSRLVAAGHNLLYNQRPLSWNAVARYFSVTIPTEIRRSAWAILTAAVLLFAPMLITYAAVLRQPELAERIMPQGMYDRAHEGMLRGGYLEVTPMERPTLAAQVMTNNIQVTFGAFAGGITAGLGTVLMLIFNGISIGGAVGLYATLGVAPLILDFMIPHGVFELTAICLAGGAGLLLARAILLPGMLDRGTALKVQGRRAIDLMTGAVVLLVFAGMIEGLISPRYELPAVVRIGVAVISALIVIGYVSLGRGLGRTHDQSDARALISR